jgi:ribosomal protein L18E
MARGACTFKQQDVTRALKATQAAGLNVQRIEIDKNGKIVVVTGEIIDQGPQPQGNEWDNL